MLTFRPHHFLCSLGYRGEGYSSKFTANMDRIVFGRLRENPGVRQLIQIVDESDAICLPCPHQRGNGCNQADKISSLDRRHAKKLALKIGQTITWGDALARIKAHVQADDLDILCTGCAWLASGVCKQAVNQLKQT